MNRKGHPEMSLFKRVLVILSSRRKRHFVLALSVITILTFILFSTSKSTSDPEFDQEKYPYGLDGVSIPITLENNRWRGDTKAKDIQLSSSTWSCTDDDLSNEEKESKTIRRSRQCVVQNLCIDRKGAFILSKNIFDKNLPKVNLMSSDEESDKYWQPRVERLWGKKINAHYVDETVFVHTLYSPFHFSHWLYNGMMPLYSTMKRFGGTKNSWTFRPDRFFYDPIERQGKWEMDHFFDSGKELVLTQHELSTSFQSLPPPDAPICFKRAVIGLGSQCALNYCEKNIPTEVYQSFRDEIADYYWKSPLNWETHLTTMQENILQEQKNRQVSPSGSVSAEIPNSPLRCLDMTRYYNFGGVSKSLVPESGELTSRVGQRYPDVVDSESNYKDGRATNGDGKRKLVVGIIQREESRRILNDQALVDELVKAGFRVKWITFDHGCGLAETAYLLRDINVVISPHGNAIGTSIFMPTNLPVSTVVSADSSRYWESWFVFTSTVLGQRFVTAACGPTEYKDEETKARCPFFKDESIGQKFVDNYNLILGLPESMVKSDAEKKEMTEGELVSMRRQHRTYVEQNPSAQKLAKEEFEVLIGPEQPYSLVTKYGDVIWNVVGNYWKANPRYVDVPRVLKFVESLQVDADKEKEKSEDSGATSTTTNRNSGRVTGMEKYSQYFEYVREGRVCHHVDCLSVLTRNIGGEDSAFGQFSMDNIPNWGQQKPQGHVLRQGLDSYKEWQVQI